jgi:peptidoglycan/xylan/chitin deacetylase (PgdA/CDA1 family)
MLRDVGAEVANHTTSHVFLRSRTPGELYAEISANRVALKRLAGSPVRYFSVPYGDMRDAAPAGQDVARKSGHPGIFLVLAKSNYFRPAPDIFFRISPENADLRKLARELFPLPHFRSARDMLGMH